jgi:hypothetical protein
VVCRSYLSVLKKAILPSLAPAEIWQFPIADCQLPTASADNQALIAECWPFSPQAN